MLVFILENVLGGILFGHSGQSPDMQVGEELQDKGRQKYVLYSRKFEKI